MKAENRDSSMLGTLQPSEIAAYLRAHGWTQRATSGQWANFVHGEDFEVTLPLSTSLRDYSRRMYDLLRTVETVEERDQTEIIADFSQASADIVRIRLGGFETRDGTVPIARAAEAINSVHDMMLAAACAAVDPKLYYPSRKPQAAAEYLKNVRMGQTERGSFVITVLSKIPPPFVAQDIAEDQAIGAPFERRVTNRLSIALNALTQSAGTAILSGHMDAFEQSIAAGVSANLCDAIAGLGESDGLDQPVHIGLSWASVRLHNAALASEFVIERDYVPVLREVARQFKSRTPIDDFEVRGPVFRLVRDPPDAPDGDVTILGVVEGQNRNIWAHLSGQDHALAASAFQNRNWVSVTGVLRKEGRKYRLDAPHDIRILDDEDDADLA